MNPEIDRKVFRDLSYGLYITTSHDEGRFNGQIVNTVIQVTSDPPRVAVIINKKNLTHEYISKSKVF
ncbi:MAG: flavin reductase family protein, partial [Desulfobacteraceae bacterium]|nr:flavin reductase family protein [Desulfobacteraceae bacterium]